MKNLQKRDTIFGSKRDVQTTNQILDITIHHLSIASGVDGLK